MADSGSQKSLQWVGGSPITDRLFEEVRDCMKPGSTLDTEKFNHLSYKLFNLHWDYNPAFRESVKERGLELDDRQGWGALPCMPISRFKDRNYLVGIDGLSDTNDRIFLSSGTTSEDKSLHSLPHLDLYEASIAGSFLHLVLKEPRWIPGYVLVTVSPYIPDSSLLYMMDYLREQMGVVSLSVDPSNEEDLKSLDNTLKDSVELDTPVIIFGTSLAMYDLLPKVEPAVLPYGSKIITTGGWKGRDIDISPFILEENWKTNFGLQGSDMLREYSMSELSSQLYGYASETPEYKGMPWIRYKIVDPLSQKEVKEGEHGAIAFYDLANAYTCPFILTEDEGSIGINGGLVLHGRLSGAVEKGCSISYEQVKEKSGEG